MVNYEVLGIPREYPEPERLFSYAFLKPSLTFKGYRGVSYYVNAGEAEFSVTVVDDGKGGKTGVAPNTHFRGYHNYMMRIERVIRNDDGGCICLCAPQIKDGVFSSKTPLPVSLVMPDVLPSILPGDRIYFQGVAFFIDGAFFKSLEEATDAIGLDSKDGALPSGMVFLGRRGYENYSYVQFYTKVKDLRVYIPVTEGCSPIYTVECETTVGEWTIVVPEYALGHGILERLSSGEELVLWATVALSGDVAIDEYQGGAVFDEEHLLRLLRYSLETGDFKKLENNMSEDCSYVGSKVVLKGRGDILGHLEYIYTEQHKREEDINYFLMGTITGKKDEDKCEYGEGKRCILPIVRDEKGFSGQGFIKVEGGKIVSIEFVYAPYYRFEIDRDDEYKAAVLWKMITPST